MRFVMVIAGVLLLPFFAYGQETDSSQQTTLEWTRSAQLSDGPVSAQVGSFVGVHNEALIVAGGPGNLYGHTVRVATRDKTTLRETGQVLRRSVAFGASVNHSSGVVIVGGTDGESARSDVTLISWGGEAQGARLISLPDLPVASFNGAAAVLGDTLFMLAGDTDAGPSREVFALDLAQANGAWQSMPPLPEAGSAEFDLAATVQNDGRSSRLFVAEGAGETTRLWVYDDGWQRKADVATNGKTVKLTGGDLVPLGQTHILLITGPGDDGIREAWSYNTITGAWAAYGDAPPVDNAVTTRVVDWGGEIVLASGSEFWSVEVNGPERSFGWVNMAVLTVYLLSMVMVGVYFVFRNKDTEDYFRGGQSIPWWAAACSIYATMLSSLTYVALPALVYRTDWLIYIGTMMILVVAPLAIYIAMPFFRQIDATSAYEYLSKRFNMSVRLFASGLFTLFHIGRMGIVLALTALALAAVTPLDPWQSVLVMGVLSLIYCTLGGVEAVIWTDTIQTGVLLVGAILCFGIIVGGVDGGFAGFVDVGRANDKFRMVNLDFGPGSITTLSIWVIVLGGIGQNISSYTADQAVVQRYMTTEDTKAAAKSIWANGLLAVPGALLFFCIGTGLYAFYQSQPEKLDPTIQVDQIFPTFIGAEMPIGLAGLIVAGIFAAAQSTVSTSMNSIATTVVTDFMRPFNVCKSEQAYLTAARILTFLMGTIGTLAGLLFISPEIRSLMEEYFKVIGMFMGALGGLFVLGITTRRANGFGALIGIFCGVGVMVSAWLMKWADGYLFATIGILTCLVVGYIASLLLPSREHDLGGLTLYTMKKS